MKHHPIHYFNISIYKLMSSEKIYIRNGLILMNTFVIPAENHSRITNFGNRKMTGVAAFKESKSLCIKK